jgi:hypothetical protein
MKSYTFHTDAGHGWLEVPTADVHELQVKPSRYSYYNGNTMFLEEDCDASAFLQAYENKFGGSPTINFAPHNDGSHPIRSLQHIPA